MMWSLLGLVLLKVIWNLGLPYAMIRARGKRHGWSIFELVEVIPLLLAAGLACILAEQGILSARNILIVGFAAIGLSYAHLLLVGFVAGWIIYGRKGSRDAGQQP